MIQVHVDSMYFCSLSPTTLPWVHLPCSPAGLNQMLGLHVHPEHKYRLTEFHEFFHVLTLPSPFASWLHFPLWHIPVPKCQDRAADTSSPRHSQFYYICAQDGKHGGSLALSARGSCSVPFPEKLTKEDPSCATAMLGSAW
jgi:hypothetical protein